MVATLNQPQYSPWPMEEQVVAIFAGINGYLDGVPVPQVPRFQDELREHMRTEKSILDAIREQKEISDELEAFAQFGSELDQATQQALNRGEKMVATLNQPQYQPWPTEEQVAALYAGVNGYLDDIPTEDVSRFQDELREQLRAQGEIYKVIRETGDLPDDLAEKLNGEIEKFKKGFNVESVETLT